jgi:hypothetical protein
MRRAVASAGHVVASIEYRTTRHHATYLDGLADVRAAVRFLRANAEGPSSGRVAAKRTDAPPSATGRAPLELESQEPAVRRRSRRTSAFNEVALTHVLTHPG